MKDKTLLLPLALALLVSCAATVQGGFTDSGYTIEEDTSDTQEVTLEFAGAGFVLQAEPTNPCLDQDTGSILVIRGFLELGTEDWIIISENGRAHAIACVGTNRPRCAQAFIDHAGKLIEVTAAPRLPLLTGLTTFETPPDGEEPPDTDESR